jgi:hypothetical protein
MKGRTSAATLGLVGGLALGVWIGAEMISDRDSDTPQPAAVATQPAEEPTAPAAPAKPRRVNRVARAASSAAAAVEAPAPESTPKLVMTIPVSAPEFHDSMRPVLARGTKLPLAVEGFTSAEQFAALARASRNTQVPFILLKHRVLTEGMSLEEAIRASKPEIDARVEALRAQGEARGDILRLQMNSASN